MTFAAPDTGLIVLDTAVEPITQTRPGLREDHGDNTTYFVPSVGVLTELVRERGLRIEIVRTLGNRAVVFMRPPS